MSPDDDPADVLPLEAHARESLRYIRTAMERAGSFTAVSGRGQVAVGGTALAAAAVAARVTEPRAWVLIWLAELVVAVAVAGAAMRSKARAAGLPLFSGAARRFALVFTLPLLAGAILTVALLRAGAFALLPGTWLTLYGVAVTGGATFSVAPVRSMGLGFLLFGVTALFLPRPWTDLCMAAAFGGLHIVFGIAIARVHGG